MLSLTPPVLAFLNLDTGARVAGELGEHGALVLRGTSSQVFASCSTLRGMAYPVGGSRWLPSEVMRILISEAVCRGYVHSVDIDVRQLSEPAMTRFLNGHELWPGYVDSLDIQTRRVSETVVHATVRLVARRPPPMRCA